MSSNVEKNKKRKFPFNDDKPITKRRKVASISSSLMDKVSIRIQLLIKQFAMINYNQLSFVATEFKYDPGQYPKYYGEIHFCIRDIDYPSSLGIFKFMFDWNYQAMDSEGEFFQESKTYYHEDKSEFIKKSLSQLLKHIFTYKNQHYSTIAISKYFLDHHQIDSIPNFHPYLSDMKYYFFREFTINPLFKNENVPHYKCTILLKNNKDAGLISNEKHYGNTLEYNRNCLIFVENESIHIYLDRPCIYLRRNCASTDVCFKLKICDTIITGNNFAFSPNDFDHVDWEFRLNKYAHPNNINNNFVDHMMVVSYWSMKSRIASSRPSEYSYAVFERNIQNSQFKMIDLLNDDMINEWDDDTLATLHDLQEKF